jgi:hypothetical protein
MKVFGLLLCYIYCSTRRYVILCFGSVAMCCLCSQTSELGVTEHIEGDECKFAVWTGRAPISDYRIVLKVSSDF